MIVGRDVVGAYWSFCRSARYVRCVGWTIVMSGDQVLLPAMEEILIFLASLANFEC